MIKGATAVKCSISDVARRAGVSTTTVSRVMNNKTSGVSQKTREKILAVMEEIDTTFAREQKATNPRIAKYTAKYHK